MPLDVDTPPEAADERANGGLAPPSEALVVLLTTTVAIVVVVGGTPVLALVGLGVLAAIGMVVPPWFWFVASLGASMFSGHTSDMGVPIPVDRALFALTVFSVLVGAPVGQGPRPVVARWRLAHLLVGAALLYVVCNSLLAGTLGEETATFHFLDRFGVVLFAHFLLAPVVLHTERARLGMLAFLTATSFYLAVVGWLEGTGLGHLAWPAYISDPTVGIHYGRARGPFTEASAMGMGLYSAAAIGWLGARRFVSREARAVAAVTGILGAVGAIFTLTRSVWLGVGIATLAAIGFDQRLRRLFVPAVVSGVVAVGLLLTVVPGFSDATEERATQQEPIWDRYNLTGAAIRAIADEPLVGVGWGRWFDENERYFEQGEEFPLTARDHEIHNVALNLLAQLGVVGFVLWLLAVTSAFTLVFRGQVDDELKDFRTATLALLVFWCVIGMFTPAGFVHGPLVMWTLAGLAATPQLVEHDVPTLEGAAAG